MDQVFTRAVKSAQNTLDSGYACRRVLVSLGGRAAPIDAIGFGRRLAEATHSTLHGLFVWPWQIPPCEVPHLLELDPDVLVGMVLDVEVGDLAEHVAAHTRVEASTLLVLPAEPQGSDRCGLGSLAAGALEACGSAVIVVRPGTTSQPIARILVPLDGEPRTAAALAPAGELARLLGAELDILMVGPKDAVGQKEPAERRIAEPGAMAPPQYVDQPQHEWGAFSREFVERFLLAIGHCPSAVPIRFFLRCGEPASEILRMARELSANLITLVWSGGCNDVHGQVFQRVLHEAGAPVLVLRY